MSRTPHTIRMHDGDNVAIVANGGGLDAGTVLQDGDQNDDSRDVDLAPEEAQ